MSPLRYENNSVCVCVCCYKDISCFAYWHHHVTHIKIMTTSRSLAFVQDQNLSCASISAGMMTVRRYSSWAQRDTAERWNLTSAALCQKQSAVITVHTHRRFYSAINLWEIISGSASCLRHTAARLQEIPADLPQAANNYQTSRPANQRPRNTAEERTLYFIYCSTHCYMQIYAA